MIYFIFGARPSWSSLQVQLNLIISFRYSARRLRSVLDYGEFPNVSKNCRCCVVGFRSLKSSHGNSHVKYFKEFEMNEKINFSMNYYLNVSLIGSSTKNDRCQNVTMLYDYYYYYYCRYYYRYYYNCYYYYYECKLQTNGSRLMNIVMFL